MLHRKLKTNQKERRNTCRASHNRNFHSLILAVIFGAAVTLIKTDWLVVSPVLLSIKPLATLAITEEGMEGERCIKLRGSSGYWHKNATLGRKTFYAVGFWSDKWKQDNINDRDAVYPGNLFARKDTFLGLNHTNLLSRCSSQPQILPWYNDKAADRLHFSRGGLTDVFAAWVARRIDRTYHLTFCQYVP